MRMYDLAGADPDRRFSSYCWRITSHSLFGGPSGRHLTLYCSRLSDSLVGAIFPFVALDILHHVADKDRAHFRETREKRVGKTLDTYVADRDDKIAAFRAGLKPAAPRADGAAFPWRSQPLYADYSLLGPFQWARCISPFKLLEEDDPVWQWRARLLDSFGGLARAAPAYDP